MAGPPAVFYTEKSRWTLSSLDNLTLPILYGAMPRKQTQEKELNHDSIPSLKINFAYVLTNTYTPHKNLTMTITNKCDYK